MAHDILVVDDEADIRMLMCGILNDEGYETREAGNSAQALAAIRSRQPTLVDAGPELAVAAPGQHHHVHMQSFTAGDTVATTTTLSFTEGNVAIEITTLFVGPDASLADAERFAALIDTRLQQGG